MRLFPAVKPLTFGCLSALLMLAAVPVVAQAQTAYTMTPAQQREAQKKAAEIVNQGQAQALQWQQPQEGTVGPQQQPPAGPYSLFMPEPEEEAMTQEELDEKRKDKESPEYKAAVLAKEAKRDRETNGRAEEEETEKTALDRPTPPEMNTLQDVHGAHGTSFGISDDALTEQIALDMRRDSQKEAALSYGARGGLAKRSYQIMERLNGYEKVLDRVFDFRQMLLRAPSGLMIEPPIVRETLDTTVIAQEGNEAAVADQVLKINKQAKIVTAPRDWRNYIALTYPVEIAPPPRILWPKDKNEQADWSGWVKQGWDAGYAQGEEIFEASLNQLVADYSGMVRYRTLLAEGKISQPFALQEDRGVTGGKNEMRVGDRALRITGPSEFLTGAEIWKPADR